MYKCIYLYFLFCSFDSNFIYILLNTQLVRTKQLHKKEKNVASVFNLQPLNKACVYFLSIKSSPGLHRTFKG